MTQRDIGRVRRRRSPLLNPVVWISVAQAIWIVVFVGWILYVIDRNERVAELARAVRAEGFGAEGESSGLAMGILLLVLLFVALVFITVSLTKYWSENRAIHRFVSTVSHELRTPLASIKLHLETMQVHPELDEEKRREFLDTSLADVDRLANSIDAILAASRIERRGIRLVLEPIALAELVERFYAERSPQVSLRRQELRLGSLEEVSVLANREALNTVLSNLVENAIHYSDEGRPIVISVERERGQARLLVVDEGRGIRGKELKNLFKMFYRGASHGGVQGTGLGLYIVGGLVRAMRGTVVVRSEGVNRGSTVTVTLGVLSRSSSPDAGGGRVEAA